tara:strand:- start:561 stop:1049 length:489 start_codon:yes stop_codon:yes gene_type:complete
LKINGLIYQLPILIRSLIIAFVLVLSIGFYTGLLFVSDTSDVSVSGIEEQYNGNELQQNADIMKFKKSSREMLTIIHTHILSMSLIFFLLGGLLSITRLNKQLKYFLVLEPFLSVILTFGGIYLMWLGITWMKYIVLISGILMTVSFILSSLIVLYQSICKK